MSREAVFEILLTSAFICKQKLLHENKTVRNLENYKCYDVNQDHFRKPSQGSRNVMKNDYPKTTRTLFTGRSKFNY